MMQFKIIETGRIIEATPGETKVWDADGNEWAYSEIEPAPTTVTILAEFLPDARKLLDKLVRKAARYGNDDIRYTVGDPFRKSVEKRHPFTGKVTIVNGPELITISVTGSAPRVGDFTFVAKIEHLATGNILDVIPGETVDHRFRVTASSCEHCNTDRRRNETFVVRSADGSEVQVGRSCLVDYVGRATPAGLIQKFAFLREFEALGSEDSDWSPHRDRGFFVDDALAATAVAIRLFGWCSKSQAMNHEDLNSTAGIVSSFFWPPTRDKYNGYIFERNDEMRRAALDTDMAYAQSAREWAVSGGAGTSEYAHNLKVLCGLGHVGAKRLGIVCSAVPAYERACDREVERTARAAVDARSAWQGAEKERLRGLIVTQIDARVIGGNDYGELVLVKFRDDAGNVFTWFTGSGSGLNNGDRAELVGTVKRHTEYKGARETQLSRCIVTKIKPEVMA